jgi:LacI family transcriptional regulator
MARPDSLSPVRATLQDIARLAGVSAKTVSRVVNGESGVSAAKRAEIQALVDKTEFRINRAAQALKSKASSSVLLLSGRINSLYSLQIISGIIGSQAAAEFNLIIDEVDPSDAAARATIVSRAVQAQVGAVIMLPTICDNAELIADLTRLGMQLVRVSPMTQLDTGTVIDMRDADGAAAAAAHLHALGHRRITVLEGMSDHAASRRRSVGFVAGWLDAGGDTSQIHIVKFRDLTDDTLSTLNGHPSTAERFVEIGMAAAPGLLTGRDPPTAIFCFNDTLALGLLWGAQSLGLTVPGDLSLVGFDGNLAASLVRPKLTTIAAPLRAIGEACLSALTTPSEKPQLLDVSLVMGMTTAAPNPKTS